MAEKNQEEGLITSENTLVIIPASGDGGEIPTTLLAFNGKPLIHYAIDIARQIAENIEICVATSEISIIKVVNEYGLFVPFMLPNELYAKVLDVDEAVLHVIDHYARKEVNFDKIVLLSPRSPFCKVEYIQEAANLLEEDVEMVAGVKTLTEPEGRYYLTENKEGYLQKHTDMLKFEKGAIYKYNNAFSILKTRAIRQYPRSFFQRIRKYVMDKKGSVFVENEADIVRCDEILSRNPNSKK